MQKIRKISQAVSEETALSTNQLLPTTPILKDVTDAYPKKKIIKKNFKVLLHTRDPCTRMMKPELPLLIMSLKNIKIFLLKHQGL